MNFDFDINLTNMIDNILSSEVLQELTFVSIAIGVGLIVWGMLDHKKGAEEEKKWNKVAILIGIIMIIRNFLTLLGI
ncbi:MAG: hypothetical protein FWG67_00230 [Defluviitaleaceae bacterium]|nr:hypothetical protein [Defluviitaleaceae bacterium]